MAAALTFQFFLFLGILRLRLFCYREKIQLLAGFRFMGRLLGQNIVSNQIQPPHQQVPVHNAVIQRRDSLHDLPGRGGVPRQIFRAMGVLGDLASVHIRGHSTVILLAALRVGQVFNIIAHRQHHLLGHQPFIHQLQHKGIRHLAYYQPCLVKFGGAVQHLPAADAGGRRLVCLDVRKGTRLPPPCMVDQQLGVGAEQAVKQLLVIKIAFLSQRTACHIAHGIQPVRLQFFGIAAPDPPKICQRLVFPQQAAIALLIQFGNAHAVFVRRDMLCLHVHRHLGKI